MKFEDEFSFEEAPQKLAETAKPEEHKYQDRDLESLPKEVQEATLARLKYVKWLKQRLIGGWTQKNLVPLLAEMPEFQGQEKPKWRTVAGWHSGYIKAEEDIHALIPKYHRKGNRKPRTDTDKFFELALTRYLTKEIPNVASAHRFYCDQIVLENDKVLGEPLKPLTYKAFKNRIDNLPQYEVMLERYGKRLADIEYSKVMSHKRPTRVLERVEIDHTPLDLILLDDELDVPLGRPTLTLLIDVYSHCVVGFYLGFQSPCYDAVRRAISHAMKPKSYLKSIYPEIVNEWLCCGKIETLVVDNGAEFWCQSLELACEEVGINISYNPVGKPWLKPFVEQFFKTINEMMLSSFPGKTFSNMLARHDYNPKKDAILRFGTFTMLFHKWIVDVYHKTPDARFRYIPYEDWNKGFALLPPAQLTEQDIDKLDVVMCMAKEKTLRKGGIKNLHINYDSDELSLYRKQYSSKKSIKVKVKINPDDLSYLYVYLDALEHYIKVPSIDPEGYTMGLSLIRHKIHLKFHKDYIQGKVELLGLAKARQFIDERVKEEARQLKNVGSKIKVTGTKAIARVQGIDNTQVKSIAKTPETKQAEPTPADTKPKEDEGSWDDFISDLDGY
ncbi:MULTISPECIES: Mu transposase C-terminal domain-containing protein [Pseudoalteromonas]|jgi:putative transposase|uniref:Mu transposase C-terminal domain-containing protein n=1 Tax=Pseudoalteromonas TaxID=53246 RepID=UPI0007813851|nr:MULTISPECIES: Mu transposase C-terminal domain-containing protein [Pseudoalteromonas]QLJ09308.1 transposase family protein [Pseudoalteromonas sp. JSTW]